MSLLGYALIVIGIMWARHIDINTEFIQAVLVGILTFGGYIMGFRSGVKVGKGG